MNFVDLAGIENSLNTTERRVVIDYNNIVSEYWFYAGQIEYWGLINNKPNLVEGFSKFVISSFYGNPKAYYKLFIILETNIIKLIIDTKEFENLKSSSTIVGRNLDFIFNSNKTNFAKNFYYKDDYEKNSIAIQFLYSSAVNKYPSAMITVAYKYYKGYGLNNSCKSALKYYKETASYNIKHITGRKKPNYYEKVNLESYEYVGQKFSNEIVDTNDVIDYLKVEALNGQINYIRQLGQRYLYGQGITQNFKEAFYYYEIGSKMNDSESIYNLGEMYLNGWGVEKV
jgi:TPR repeat protein